MPAVVVGVAVGLGAATVTTTLTAIAIGVAAAIVSDAMMPKIPEIGADTSNQALTTDAASRRTKIYGQTVVSGPIVKYSKEKSAGKEYHHFFTPLANHQCEEVRLYQLDGKSRSSLSGNGYRLIPRDGTQVSALSTAVAEMSNVDSTFVGYGITDVYHRYEINNEIFPNGISDVKFIVKGALVYDPRKDGTMGGDGAHRYDDKSTWEWSDNPALINLDWKRFGGDIELGIELFDMANVASEANICDELVTIRNSNDVEVTEKRYTCNGVIDLSRGSKANELELLSSCSGRWVQSADKYYLLTGAYRGPALITITDDDIKGDIVRNPVASLDSRCNAVTSTFISKNNFYQKTDSTKIVSTFYREQKDKNRYLEHDRVYSFTQTDTMVQRLNRQYMEYVRAGDTLTMDVGVVGMSCAVGSTVNIKSLNTKINDKEYEVLHNRIDLNKKICSLVLKETAPAIHADTNIAAEQDLTPNTEIDNTFVEPPTNIQFTEDSTKPTRVGFLTWQHPVDSAVEYYKVEITNTAGDETYRPIQRPADPYVDLFNLNVGNYVARIQAFNTFGRASTVATQSFTLSTVFNSASSNFLFGQLPPEDSVGENGQFYMTIPGGIVYIKENGTWSIDGNLAADGDRWLSGTSDPSDSLGTNGDWYIRLPEYLTWQKIDGTWVASGSIKGASGSPGDKGDPGNNGQSVFTTYNSSVSQPGQPPTDGTGDGWTLTHNASTRWQAQKTAIDINSGTWGIAAPFRGADGASVTIASSTINGNGDRVVTFSDGSTITIPKGIQGDTGTARGVKPIYATNSSGSSASFTQGTRQFANFYEWTGAPPSSIPGGLTYGRITGEKGEDGIASGVKPIYSTNSSGSSASFIRGTREYVNFYEWTGSPPSSPPGGLSYVKFIGEDGISPVAPIRDEGANNIAGLNEQTVYTIGLGSGTWNIKVELSGVIDAVNFSSQEIPSNITLRLKKNGSVISGGSLFDSSAKSFSWSQLFTGQTAGTYTVTVDVGITGSGAVSGFVSGFLDGIKQ